jgi:hypothetical protein
MGVLLIGEKEKSEIASAIAAARAKPMPWEVMREVVVDDRDEPKHTLKLDEHPDQDRLAKIGVSTRRIWSSLGPTSQRSRSKSSLQDSSATSQ